MNNAHSKHHHDGNCSCGCHDDHHHHPGPSQQPEPHSHHPITVKTHDSSLVGSYRFDLEVPFDEAETILDRLLKQVSQEVTALGGIIGHIKAMLNSEGHHCMISITEDESNKHRTVGSLCHVEGVAIVFCIAPDQLETILKRVFNAYLG